MPDDPERRPRVTIELLHDQLRAAVEAIETGDQWRDWLEFAGKLHRYSFGNLMLIMAQRPDATAVASYTTWKAANRQVQRGERSIKVMAPITCRTQQTDADGKPIIDAEGRTAMRRTVVGYRPVPVFDIKQTSGPPVPEPVRPNLLHGEAPAGLWDALAREVAERGYRLLRKGADQFGTANGVTLPHEREVWVRDDVDAAQAVKTLAHELAHVMLHADDLTTEPCRGVMEVEAESVAYLTLAAHGVASDTYTFPYVAHWAYALAAAEHVPMADIVTRTGQRVTQTTRTIIDATTPDGFTAPVSAALAERTMAAAERTTVMREDAEARALPPIERAVLLGVVADSDAYFRSQVRDSWVPGYLAERGLASAVGTHDVGYAPAGWSAVTDHLRSLGYGDDHIEAAGMATRAKTGRLVDRFRDRMTLPLRDRRDDLVGFTARCRPDADRGSPKYLNSPSTRIFKKSELILGLARHRDELGSGHVAVITEGPLDAIAVDLAARQTGHAMVGFSTSGTAFSDAQAQTFANLPGPPTICLAYDGDDAGRNAAERAWNKITNTGVHDVTIAELPSGTDPASLADSDPGALAQLLREARSAPYVLADRRIDSVDPDNSPMRYVTFRELLDWAERLPVEQRVDLALHVARRLDIDAEFAAEEIAERRTTFLDATTDSVIKHSADLKAALAGTSPRADYHDETVTHRVAIAR